MAPSKSASGIASVSPAPTLYPCEQSWVLDLNRLVDLGCVHLVSFPQHPDLSSASGIHNWSLLLGTAPQSLNTRPLREDVCLVTTPLLPCQGQGTGSDVCRSSVAEMQTQRGVYGVTVARGAQSMCRQQSSSLKNNNIHSIKTSQHTQTR